MINFDHSCEYHVHLDGKRVQLDEKYALCRNAQFVHAQIRTFENPYMLKFVHAKKTFATVTSMFKYVDQAHVTN